MGYATSKQEYCCSGETDEDGKCCMKAGTTTTSAETCCSKEHNEEDMKCCVKTGLVAEKAEYCCSKTADGADKHGRGRCCVGAGRYSAAQSQCCSQKADEEGKCCIGVGEFTASILGDDCCSGKANVGTRKCCARGGQPYDDDPEEDCCSGKRNGDKCCDALGSSSDKPENCCSGKMAGNKCCVDVGESAEDASSCCSGMLGAEGVCCAKMDAFGNCDDGPGPGCRQGDEVRSTLGALKVERPGADSEWAYGEDECVDGIVLREHSSYRYLLNICIVDSRYII